MDQEQDFNSSDLEFDDGPPNPFANAGRASIQKMLENAVELRISSKKAVKQLVHVKESNKTQYSDTLWFNRFQAFRESILRVQSPKSEAPTGEQFERFLASIVLRIKPRANEVPSYSWVKQGIRRLVGSCVFHFPTFTLSRHENERISTAVHSLLKEGKLTKNPSWERNWVGAFLVRKLAVAMFRDALSNGTLNWDVTMSKVLFVVTAAALIARTGDLTKAPLDEQRLPFICYKDITLKFVGGSGLEDLKARFVIRNEKGDKNDPAKNRSVTVDCVKGPENNVVCPIKLLLILALRLGQVSGTTIDEVLNKAQSRRDKTVVWTEPERPVFCAYESQGTALRQEKPAGSHQLTQTLALAGPLAGFLTPIRSHDLRRGSARDVANLDAEIKGVATLTVAAVMGHSNAAHTKDVTARYVGPISDSTWSTRLEKGHQDPYGIEVTNTVFSRKRKLLDPAQITAQCRRDGLDEDSPSARRISSKRLGKKRIDDWRQAELERVHKYPDGWRGRALSTKTPSEINIAAGQVKARKVGSVTSTALPNEDLKVSARTRFAALDDMPIHPQLMSLESDTLASRLTSHEDLDVVVTVSNATPVDVPVDAQLLGRRSQADVSTDPPNECLDDPATTLDDTQDDGPIDAESLARDFNSLTGELDSAYFDQMQKPAPVVRELDSDPVTFVTTFSKINVTTNQSFVGGPSMKEKYLARSADQKLNSRDELTSFQYSCKNEAFGCEYQHKRRVQLVDHERTCKITSVEALEELNREKEFPCGQDNCNKSFDTKPKRDSHVKNVHEWEPRACKKDECDPTVIYPTKTLYETHMKEHAAFKPTKCLLAKDCGSETVFQRSTIYRRHLLTVHNITDRHEKDKLMPDTSPLSRPGNAQSKAARPSKRGLNLARSEDTSKPNTI